MDRPFRCPPEVKYDPEDAALLAPYGRWYIHMRGRWGYACTNVGGRKRRRIAMHRLITGAPPELVVDHINGDTLDNRRSNLRIVTLRENAQNTAAHRDSKSGLRGVAWDKSAGRWRANALGKRLGYFDDPLAAHAAAVAYLRAHAPGFVEGR